MNLDKELKLFNVPDEGAYEAWSIESRYIVIDHDGHELIHYHHLDSGYSDFQDETVRDIKHVFVVCSHCRNADGLSGEGDDDEFDSFSEAHNEVVRQIDEFNARKEQSDE